MENTIITYRKSPGSDLESCTASQYLKLLQDSVEQLCDGTLGTHLSPKISINGQDFFHPVLLVNGSDHQSLEENITEAIFHTTEVIRSLARLDADSQFKIIATGEGGFCLISRKALPMDYLKAFEMFVRLDLVHAQTVRMEEPLTLFAFASSPLSFSGNLNFHSTPLEMPWHDFGPEDYLEWTRGSLEADKVIAFMEWLLNNEPVTDTSTLNQFGQRLEHYRTILASSRIIPFHATKVRRAPKPLSLEAVADHLQSRGIKSKIENRGNTPAISFDRLDCPSCGRSDVRAWAYPPFYRLQCFNPRCKASIKDGIPLIQWAGMVNDYERRNDANSQMAFVRPRQANTSLADARSLIRTELANDDNVLLLVTPGVGKTHETLQYLATACKEKTVIYSCLNRKLKDQAYRKCLELGADPARTHNIKPREDLCQKAKELQDVTQQGYSPARTLCRKCSHRKNCQYLKQRTNLSPGVYFVTHPMLEYLTGVIPNPDLIILDEDLLRGFVSEESATQADMRTLLKILSGHKAAFVENLIQISSIFATQVTTSGITFSQSVNAFRISKSDLSEDTILDFYARHFNVSDVHVLNCIEDVFQALNQLGEKYLFDKKVNHRAVEWINGLSQYCSSIFSYLEATPGGNAFFKTRRLKQLAFASTPVKILDATGHPGLSQALTSRQFRVTQASVAWSCSATHIRQKLSRTNLASMRPNDLKKLLKLCLDNIKSSKILILTHQTIAGDDFAQKVLALCKSLSPNKSFKVHHFFGPRGINDYQGCEAVLVIGSPIPNLNSTWQQASILFPEKNQEEIREAWVDLSTNWELIQCLHRVRPIYNKVTEIVLAGDIWPSALPDPVRTIDESRNPDKIRDVAERLRPFLKEFGFMNRDLALLAGVYKKGRQERLYRTVNENFLLAEQLLSVNRVRATPDWPPLCALTTLSQKVPLSAPCLLRISLIGKVHSKTKSNFVSTISLLSTLRERKSVECNAIIINDHQLRLAIKGLRGTQKQLTTFSLKSGFGGGHVIDGIGLPGKAEEFYSSLNESGLFPKTDLASVSYGSMASNMKPLQKGVVIVKVSEYSDEIVHVAWEGQNAVRETRKFVEGLADNLDVFGDQGVMPKIVTNQGKLLARLMLENNLPEIEVHDVMLNERILTNGLKSSRNMTLYELMEDYGKDPEDLSDTRVLHDIWEEQTGKIQQFGINWVADLERDMIKVVARMEHDGMEVDGDGMHDWLEAEGQLGSRSAIDRIYSRIGSDGRFHDQIDQLGEVSARMSSQLDRIPRSGSLRSLFKTQRGHYLIVADYRQQEPRIMAGLSGDEKMLRIFSGGEDYYEAAGNNMEAMVDLVLDRALVKKVVNGINYTSGLPRVYRILREAGKDVLFWGVKAFYDGYKANFTGLFEWQEKMVWEARRQGFVATVMGRRRYIDASVSPARIINYIVSGTAADAFKDAVRKLERDFNGMNARVVHTMRDGLIVEVEEALEDPVEEMVQGRMENAFAGMVPGVEFPVKIEPKRKWKEEE